MRELTVLETQNIEYVSDKGIKFAFVLLTENILSHSIFDATRQMVAFLKECGIHDFSTQQNGTEHRKFVNTHILTFKEDIKSRTSLYKAGTRGDKRMWFGAEVLPAVDSNNMVIVIAKDNEINVINISKIDIEYCCSTNYDNPIKRLIKRF